MIPGEAAVVIVTALVTMIVGVDADVIVDVIALVIVIVDAVVLAWEEMVGQVELALRARSWDPAQAEKQGTLVRERRIRACGPQH